MQSVQETPAPNLSTYFISGDCKPLFDENNVNTSKPNHENALMMMMMMTICRACVYPCCNSMLIALVGESRMEECIHVH